MIQDTSKVEGHFRSDIFLAFLIGKSSNIVVYFIIGLGGLTHSCRSSQSFLHVRARSSSPISTFCCFFTYPLVMIISWPLCSSKKAKRGQNARQGREHTSACLAFCHEVKLCLRQVFTGLPVLSTRTLNNVSRVRLGPYRSKGCNRQGDHSWARMVPGSRYRTR